MKKNAIYMIALAGFLIPGTALAAWPAAPAPAAANTKANAAPTPAPAAANTKAIAAPTPAPANGSEHAAVSPYKYVPGVAVAEYRTYGIRGNAVGNYNIEDHMSDSPTQRIVWRNGFSYSEKNDHVCSALNGVNICTVKIAAYIYVPTPGKWSFILDTNAGAGAGLTIDDHDMIDAGTISYAVDYGDFDRPLGSPGNESVSASFDPGWHKIVMRVASETGPGSVSGIAKLYALSPSGFNRVLVDKSSTYLRVPNPAYKAAN